MKRANANLHELHCYRVGEVYPNGWTYWANSWDWRVYFTSSRDPFFHWGFVVVFFAHVEEVSVVLLGVCLSHHINLSVLRIPTTSTAVIGMLPTESDRSPADSGFFCSTKMPDMTCTLRIYNWTLLKGVWLCLTLYNMVLGSPNHQFWDPMILRGQFSFGSPEFLAWFLSNKQQHLALSSGILQKHW